MKKYSFLFFIKQSLGGLFMNGVMSITSVFILMSCLLLMGCFGLLIFNVNVNLDQLDELNKIIFYIKKEYNTPEEIERIKSEIVELSNTKRINFISSKEALDMELGWMTGEDDDLSLAEDDEFVRKLEEDNPLRASIEIEYIDINDVNTLKYQLEGIEGWSKTRDMAETAEVIKNLKNVVMLVLMWFLIVLFIIAIFIILNTVKLSVHSRKEEIIIMRYIGATKFFIMFPFVLEGILIGIVSACIAYFTQWYVYQLATSTLLKMDTGGLSFIEFSDINIIVFMIFAVVGVFCGLIGSSISANKYLKA